MKVVELKCPNCGEELINVRRGNQGFTTCKNCQALVFLQKDNLLYNLEGSTNDYIKKGDFYVDKHMISEASVEYLKASLLDKNNEYVKAQTEKYRFSEPALVKKNNISDTSNIKAIKCPNCDANLKITTNIKKIMQCPYCKSSLIVDATNITTDEVLEKVFFYYNKNEYDKAIIELEELAVRNRNNEFYNFFMNVLSSLNRSINNEIVIIDDEVIESFKKYYLSLSEKKDKNNVYGIITSFVSKLCDNFLDDDYFNNQEVLDTILEFLESIALVLDYEELMINNETRSNIIKAKNNLKRDEEDEDYE